MLSEPVDIAHAPEPTNDSERLLFRTIFETLIYLDCGGEVRPGLAESWERDGSGRTWTFRLRADASYAGGPSAAADAAAFWRAHPEAMKAGGIASVEALDQERLRVTMLAPQDSVPRVLADPGLGILHGRGSILGRADRFLIPTPRSSPPVTEFRVEPGTDPRDALDHGADVLVTRDPALVDYASSRSEFTSFPLPWSRTYVLLQPAGAGLISGVFGVDSLASSLARDVARTEARPAQPPFWWRGPQACLVDLSFVVPPPRAARILYLLGDEVARNIAERIVALAAETRLRATGLRDSAFATALREQGDLGYIVALPRQVSAPCQRSQALPHGAWIQPLIDTRARAIVRNGVPPFAVEWDGTLRLVQP